ncbi:sulfatase [Bdellovibrio sp. NC01]|nr:sulfatase [Bdellovibrio sp. NC01]
MFGPSQRILKIFTLICVVIGFYFIARIEFLAWNWNMFRTKPVADLFYALFVGLRFDISAAFSVAAPILLLSFLPWPQSWERFWRVGTWIIFAVTQIPFLILNLVDTEFINFVGRRFTYDTLFIVGEAQGKMMGFIGTYWLLFLINTVITFAFGWCAWKVVQANWKVSWPTVGRAKHWALHGFLSFVAIVITVVAIRGGLQGKPISFVNANVFTAPVLNNLVLNSTFTFIKSYGADEIKHEKYFTNKDEMLKYLNGSIETPSLLEGKRPSGKQNVVIIILESFGSEYVGPHNGKTYTPFLDSLMAKSLVFNNAYADGRRSIEGIAAVMAGIPALMSEPFISSHFTANYFLGMGTLLSPKKYSSAFFHGGHNGTMYFDSFMQSAGVEKYYGSTEYANSKDDDGIWGIWDEPFLQFMLTKIDTMSSPFLASVFTLSSHHPFKVPVQYEKDFPEGPIEILKTVSYTDMALKKFFAEAEKKPWFKDTLFIVTADHTSKHYLPEFENEVGDYRIPLFFYHPTYKFPAVDRDMVVQQIDILPSVLDFLGIRNKEENFLGSSVFIPGDKDAVAFIDDHYLLFAKDYRIRWSPGRTEPQMFAMSDVVGENPLTEPAARKNELTLRLKASIQYFNEGMWDNKLYYPALRK